VTHDQVEAMTLADRIVVLNAGRVEQVGAPLGLYNDPRNLFVAGFIGSPRMNFVEGRVTRDGPAGISIVTAGGERLQLAGPWTGLAEGQPVTLGLRPERLRPATGPGRLLLAGDVAVVERLGGESLVHLKQATGNILTMKMDGAADIGLGQNLALAFEEKDLHLFDAEGRRILPQAR
jgi:multiple sugar transport system ATP-binding protein